MSRGNSYSRAVDPKTLTPAQSREMRDQHASEEARRWLNEYKSRPNGYEYRQVNTSQEETRRVRQAARLTAEVIR